MSTLYIRLPCKAATDSVTNWLALPCPFAQVSSGNAIERQGTAALSELSAAMAAAQRVVLLLAASDVTLLRVKVPPLSSAKLKAALPNLAEDQLISDPADCVVVAGDVADGLRTVAVVQRAWLDTLTKAMLTLGAQQFVALPAQLCLPNQAGRVAAAISEQDGGIDMTLRLSEQTGIGLALGVAHNETAAHEVIQSLVTLLPNAPITLYVPQSSVRVYQDAVHQISTRKISTKQISSVQTDTLSINVLADNWSHWISGARSATLNLMAGNGAGSGPVLDWRAWRWPLALTTALLLINAAALNIGWWQMKSEATALRATLTQIYKSAYPKESVILDPIAQMQQKISAAKHTAGLASPDDFTVITAAFGEAWDKIKSSANKTSPAIAAIEYRERSLLVRLKPIGDASAQQLKAALAERKLSVDLLPEQSGMAVWQIRSAP